MKLKRLFCIILLGILAISAAAEELPTIAPAVEVTPEPPPAVWGESETSPEATAAFPETLPETAPAATAEPGNIVHIRVTAVGDCTLGGDIPSGDYKVFDRYFNQNGPDYFFENVRKYFENDDLTIVNLEGPLTNAQKKRGYRFNFRGRPEYVQILSGSSVEIANIANNHTYDYKEEGAQETLSVLDQAGIGASGYDVSYYTDVNGVRVGSIGFTQWKSSTEEMVAATQEARTKCDVLIVSVHWGKEGHREATSDQLTKGHALVDAGADLVLGTHPHVYGGVELYRGRYIVYSLGNFCFGGNNNPGDKNSLIFRQDIVVDTDTMSVWDGGIDIIPVRISGKDNTNTFQPYVQSVDDRCMKLLRGIAKQSPTDFADIKWLPDSYFAQNGLIPQSTDTAENGN